MGIDKFNSEGYYDPKVINQKDQDFMCSFL